MIGEVVLPGEKLSQFEEGDIITDQFTMDSRAGIISNEAGVLKEQKTKKGKVISILASPTKVSLDWKTPFYLKPCSISQKQTTTWLGWSLDDSGTLILLSLVLFDPRHQIKWIGIIGSYKQAILGVTDFQGATQKLRPNLALKSLVYARVESFCPFLKIKLTCQTINKSKARIVEDDSWNGKDLMEQEWTTGEAFFGELKGGLDFQVSSVYARQLLRDESVFSQIKKHSSFEVAIGVNGVIWIKAKNEGNNVIIMNIIKTCEGASTHEIQKTIQDFSSFLFPEN